LARDDRIVDMKGLQRLVVASGSGALASLAFLPGFGEMGWLLVFPGWAGLWWAVKGGGFCVVAVVALLVFGTRRGWRNPWALGCLLLLIVLGIWRPAPSGGKGTMVPVMLVQSEACMPGRYLELSVESGFRDGFVVWPEYAVPYDIFQHAGMFRHRALENGRWMAVASTSGRTQVIDPHGVVRAELPIHSANSCTRFPCWGTS